MKTKKFLSLVLAMVMALSLAVPAFASANTDTSLTQSTAIGGTTKIPTIKITVPATGSVVLNPYEMGVTVDGNTISDPIVSVPQYVINASDVAVKVKATVTGKPSGAAKLVDASTATDTTGINNVFLQYIYEIGDDNTVDPDGTNKIVVKAKGEATDLGTLAQGTGTAAAAAGAYLAYKLTGDLVAIPTKAWTEKDTVSVNVAYTFIPQKYEAAPPSAGDASVTVAISGTTATATFNAGTSGLTATSYAWTSSDTTEATVSGSTTATETISQAGTATSGNTSIIAVTVTLSNGATVTGSATYTCT